MFHAMVLIVCSILECIGQGAPSFGLVRLALCQIEIVGYYCIA